MPERDDAWITDYAFEAMVEDQEGYESHIQVVELQNVHKIVAEAMRRGEAKAWSEAKELVYKIYGPGYSATILKNEIDAKLTSFKKV